MATRYYPTRFSPSLRVSDVAPIVNGTWEHGDIQTYRPSGIFRLKTSKADGGLRLPAEFRCNRQGNYDFPFVRLMTPPLEAQTIDGTFDLAFQILERWSDGVTITDDAKLRWKLHIYIAVGESTTVRHTLLANHIDSADWPNPTLTWTGLAAPVALTSGSAVAGDVIVIELGMRVVSTPASVIGYPAETFAVASVTGFGTTDISNVELPDAVQGTSTPGRSAWFEFSDTITEAAGSAPPSNELCANAISIPSLPYTSSFIDTTGSADPGVSGGGRAAYWVWTAEKTGKAFFATYGSNYTTQISIATGSCGSLVIVNPTSYTRDSGIPGGNSMSSAGFDVTEGVIYHIIVEHNAGSFAEHAANGGGACRLVGFYRDVPVEDDLYLVAWDILALREAGGVVSPVNLGAALQGFEPSGVGIDYTKRPMVPISGDNPNPHVSDRLLVSLFSFDLVEILDLQTLSWAPSINEIDFIGAPYVGADNPAQLHLTRAGFLWQGFFGNGFNLVVGAGALPALLDVVSSPLDAGTLYGLDATSGDNQADAPFTARKLNSPHPAAQITAPWAITIDEAANTLYYTAGGFYDPLSGEHPTRDSTVATIIKRYDLTNNVQLPDFATVTPQAGSNPGLKGLRFMPLDGGLLACNSTQVIRFNSVGGVVRVYTPSNAQDSQSLVDVVLTADQTSFWVLDEATVHVFKFNLATGVEEADFPTYLVPGTTVQMQIFQPNALEVCPPTVAPAAPADDSPAPAPTPVPSSEARTLIFELPQRRWLYDQYDRESIRMRLFDPGDNVHAQILGGGAGHLYQYDAAAFDDAGTNLAWRIWTHWPDANDPRGEKIVSDLVLDVDPRSSVGGITAAPVANNAQRILSDITVGADLTGRQQLSLNPVSGAGLVARNVGLRLSGAVTNGDTARPILYEWIFAWVPNWVNAGTPRAKFFQGLVIHADTGNVASSFRVDSGDGVAQESFTVQATGGELGIPYSFTTPFIAHLVRLVPLGSWRILGVDWVWEPTPESVIHWQTQPTTHDLPGYLTVRDGMIAYAAPSDVTWTITYTDGGSTAYTLPATGGAYTRLYVPLVARKGTAVTYDFVSDCPFQLFQRDCSVRIQGWGQPGGLQVMTPFGGLTRERGARI